MGGTRVGYLRTTCDEEREAREKMLPIDRGQYFEVSLIYLEMSCHSGLILIFSFHDVGVP